MDPKLDPKLDRKVDPKLDPRLDRKLDRKVDPKLDRKLDRKVDPRLDRKLDRKVDPKLDPKLDRKLDRKVDPKNVGGRIEKVRFRNNFYLTNNLIVDKNGVYMVLSRKLKKTIRKSLVQEIKRTYVLVVK